MPTVALSHSKFEAGYPIVDLFTDAGLAPTKSEARRLVQQGGAFVSSGGDTASLAVVTGVATLIKADALDGEGELILRAGKKRFCRVVTKKKTGSTKP
jgi:tyrosyl-tRNA synthetase